VAYVAKDWPETARKILNRRNEPKDLLETHGLALSGPKNELVLACCDRQSNRKERQTNQENGRENNITGEGK
jgi:hypothetical protein